MDDRPRTLDQIIAHYSVIVLLGRPGAGKSTELRQGIKKGWFDDGPYPPIVRPGKSLDSNETARQFLFDRDDWKRTEGRNVTLVIDGLDEIIQVNPRFMEAFDFALREEKERRAHAIRLVLVCRSAEWTGSSITQLWGEKHYIAAELCQLTEEAADGFVRSRLKEVSLRDKFWEEASRLKLHALVLWPHSLDELVSEFQDKKELPSSHFKLIRAAALRRSSPWDKAREQRLLTSTDARWMFRLAGRVAAVSIFTGSPAVSIEDWKHSEEEEPWKGKPRLIEKRDLDELKHTDFFDIGSNGRLLFQHQIFREHMAAAWLADRKLTTYQLQQLFGRKHDKGWRHYPQLATVAAWLASDPEQTLWRRFLIDRDPMVLLRADAMNLPDAEKIEIARALLKQALNDGWVDQGEAHQALHTLACAGLDAVIAPYLDEVSPKSIAARQLAITLAVEARLTALVPKLWQRVKAPDEPLRTHIARSLRELAIDPKFLPEWEAVFEEATPSDEHGILLGAALFHLIPKHKSVSDALHLLLPPRHFDILGGITFNGVAQEMPEKITNEDILPIMERSEKHHAIGFGEGYSNKETILSAAMSRMGKHMDDPVYMQAFARWWFARLIGHAPGPEWKKEQAKPESSPLDFLGFSEKRNPVTLDDMGFNEANRRHAFLRSFARLYRPFTKTARDARYMAHHVKTFVRLPEDIRWLIEQLDQRPGEETAYWGELLSNAYYAAAEYPGWKPVLEEAFARHAVLHGMLPAVPAGKSFFEHLDHSREVSRLEREQEARDFQKRLKDNASARADDLKRGRQLAELEAKAGNPEGWITLTTVLDATSGNSRLDTVNEVLNGPPWMRAAARLYLLQSPSLPYPGPTDAHSDYHLRFCSTWAVYVLGDEIFTDAKLKSAVFTHWLPFVLSAMTWHALSNDQFNATRVLRDFGDDAIRACLKVLAHSYVNHGGLYQVRVLADVWNDQVGQRLADLLTGTPPQPEGFAEALEFLARHDLAKARQVADHWLDSLPRDAENETCRTLLAALLTSLPGYRWDEYASVIKASEETTRSLLIQAFGRMGLSLDKVRRLAEFPDAFLAELVELMFVTFPPQKDPSSYHRGGTVSSLDETLYARDQLFGRVQDRGLIHSISRLRELSLPGTERWFSYAASKAQGIHHSAAWKPLEEQALLALARQSDLTLVRNEDDFFEAVSLAVRRYGEEVITTERLNDIWDRTRKLAHPEERISDYLALWLKDQLKVLPSREAQTMRGKKTDIDVSMTIPGQSTFHTVVEVKKSDRENLMHGMQTQLRDDYLLTRGKTHGLYVVFWLLDGESKIHSGITTAAKLQQALEAQAASLSKDSIHIRALVFDCKLPLKWSKKQTAPKRARTTTDTISSKQDKGTKKKASPKRTSAPINSGTDEDSSD